MYDTDLNEAALNEAAVNDEARTPPRSRIRFYDYARRQESFGEAMVKGLAGAPKSIPARFLYDAEGSALFDRICALPEYYPTRTEMRILKDHAGEMAARMGPHAMLVELGSGSSVKVRLLLDAMNAPAAYVPIDISREHLIGAAEALAAEYPSVQVSAVCADYGETFPLPPSPGAGRQVAFFPGSTIGNLEPADAQRFLAGWAASGVDMLVGVDLIKDRAILEPAYDDAQGVTAAFSLNVLARANRELGADFDLSRFAHRSRWNPEASRIEIHIESLMDQSVRVNGQDYGFRAGEPIETEHSYKYSVDGFRMLAERAGYRSDAVWVDSDALFAVHYLAAETP
jgi:dimethylhistidine N-methyltransferase